MKKKKGKKNKKHPVNKAPNDIKWYLEHFEGVNRIDPFKYRNEEGEDVWTLCWNGGAGSCKDFQNRMWLFKKIYSLLSLGMKCWLWRPDGKKQTLHLYLV